MAPSHMNTARERENNAIIQDHSLYILSLYGITYILLAIVPVLRVYLLTVVELNQGSVCDSY